jgi:phage terminase large subunit GpA-like protein
MDALNAADVEEIIFVKCTQVGGTEALNNILAYIVTQDPNPSMIVYSTVELAESVSKNRLQSMIQLCDVLKDRYSENGSKLLELQFNGMYLALSGAN